MFSLPQYLASNIYCNIQQQGCAENDFKKSDITKTMFVIMFIVTTTTTTTTITTTTTTTTVVVT